MSNVRQPARPARADHVGGSDPVAALGAATIRATNAVLDVFVVHPKRTAIDGYRVRALVGPVAIEAEGDDARKVGLLMLGVAGSAAVLMSPLGWAALLKRLAVVAIGAAVASRVK